MDQTTEIKETLYALFTQSIIRIETLYFSENTENTDNKGLDTLKEVIKKLKDQKLFITIHQPDISVSTGRCSMRLWAIEPHIGDTGHPDNGQNYFNLVEVWPMQEVAENFIKEHSFITLIEQKGVGGSFASKGTALYKVEQ